MQLSKNATVNEYIAALDISFKVLFLKLRETVLLAEPNFEEDIKWKNCLTYIIDKKNLIQTVVGKDKVSLIFHNGAAIDDDSGLLTGEGKKTRTARFNSPGFDTAVLTRLIQQSVKIHRKQ